MPADLRGDAGCSSFFGGGVIRGQITHWLKFPNIFFNSNFVFNKLSPVMGRDNSWPATVTSVVTVPTGPFAIFTIAQPAHFCLSGRSANPETPKMAEPYFRSQIWWQN